MTGYGQAELRGGRYQASVEIKTYNNRFLDMAINIPPSLNPLEERMRDFIRTRVSRGRIECGVRFRDMEEGLQVSLDRAHLDSYLGVLSELRDLAGIAQGPTLSDLLGIEGLVKIERQRDVDAYWIEIEALFDRAFRALDESREREGLAIRDDILGQLERVTKAVDLVRARASDMETQVKKSLREKFHEVLGDAVDEQRVLSELAVQLARLTIHEEIVRMDAHVDAMRRLILGNENSGKKLDFFCQEMNREINTIGSKNTIIEISGAVVEVKDALENIREQIRNVE